MKTKPLATRLRQLRKLNNYSQQDIADELNIIRQTYSHYETGRNYPNAEMLYKISNIYHVPVDTLLDLTINDKNENHTFDILDQISSFFNSDCYKNKKVTELNMTEKELLFYFNNIDSTEKIDILNFIKSRSTHSNINN